MRFVLLSGGPNGSQIALFSIFILRERQKNVTTLR